MTIPILLDGQTLPCDDLYCSADGERARDFLLAATKMAAVSLLECVFDDRFDLGTDLRASLSRALPFLQRLHRREGDQTRSGLTVQVAADENMSLDSVQALCEADGVQAFLLNTGNRIRDMLKVNKVVRGVYKMNEAGRGYVLENPESRPRGANTMGAAKRCLDCLWAHLQENPRLCRGRRTLSGRKRKLRDE